MAEEAGALPSMQHELCAAVRYYCSGPERHSWLPHRQPHVEEVGNRRVEEAWQRCAGLLLVVSLLGRSPAFPSKHGGMDRSVGNSEALARRAARVSGTCFTHSVEMFRSLMRMRSLPSSKLWSRRHFKIASFHLLSAARRSSSGAQRHAELAAAAFDDCLAPDPGAAAWSRLPLYPDQRCLLTLARGGCLTCGDIAGGRDAVTDHIAVLLRAHRPHDVDLALISFFQISLDEVEAEARALVGAALAFHASPVKGNHPPLPRRLLVALLKRRPAAWWNLPADQLRACLETLRTSRDSADLAGELEAWMAPSTLSRAQVLDAVASGAAPRGTGGMGRARGGVGVTSGVASAAVLAGLRHWAVDAADLPGGAGDAFAYAQALLEKPRSHFVPAIGVIVHFRLGQDDGLRQALEVDILRAMASLARTDVHALKAASEAVLEEPSLTVPPADWAGASATLRRSGGNVGGRYGPRQWPSWDAFVSNSGGSGRQVAAEAPTLPCLRLSVPVHFVETADELTASCEALCAAGIVALDAEWTPGAGAAALLQLARHEDVFLWDLRSLPADHVRRALARVLGDEGLLKLGFGFRKGDWPQLAPWAQTCNSLIDLDQLWSRLHPRESAKGLQALVSKALSTRLDKSEQCSDWERRPLSRSQLDYAALDAHCLLQVWDRWKVSEADRAAVICNLPSAVDSVQTSGSDEEGQLEFAVAEVAETWPLQGSRHLSGCVVDAGPSRGRLRLVQGGEVAIGQRVLVLCCLKPREIHGEVSEGGLLVAYYADGRREAAAPPPAAALGATAAADCGGAAKSLSQLRAAEDGEIHIGGAALQVDGQPCRVPPGVGVVFR